MHFFYRRGVEVYMIDCQALCASVVKKMALEKTAKAKGKKIKGVKNKYSYVIQVKKRAGNQPALRVFAPSCLRAFVSLSSAFAP